jgi:hypothetical protein
MRQVAQPNKRLLSAAAKTFDKVVGSLAVHFGDPVRARHTVPSTTAATGVVYFGTIFRIRCLIHPCCGCGLRLISVCHGNTSVRPFTGAQQEESVHKLLLDLGSTTDHRPQVSDTARMVSGSLRNQLLVETNGICPEGNDESLLRVGQANESRAR